KSMPHHYTTAGAHVLMASAVLFLGLAGWSAAGPAPAKPLQVIAMVPTHDVPVQNVAIQIAPVAEAQLPAGDVAPLAELPSLPTLQPMPALENVAINISIPASRPPAPPKQTAARTHPRKSAAPVPVAVQPAPPNAPEPAIRTAESGARA